MKHLTTFEAYSFDREGTEIKNPFTDETARQEVDPNSWYADTQLVQHKWAPQRWPGQHKQAEHCIPWVRGTVTGGVSQTRYNTTQTRPITPSGLVPLLADPPTAQTNNTNTPSMCDSRNPTLNVYDFAGLHNN